MVSVHTVRAGAGAPAHRQVGSGQHPDAQDASSAGLTVATRVPSQERVRWFGLVSSSRSTRSRCTGATNRSSTGVVKGVAVLNGPVPTASGGMAHVDRVDRGQV